MFAFTYNSPRNIKGVNSLRTKQVLKGALVILFAVSTSVPQWTVYGESISSESESREVETTETTDAGNETKSSTSQTETNTETTVETSVTSTDQETTATTDNQQTEEATATKCQTTNPLLLK